MKTIVTHDNFNECVIRVLSGVSCFYIPTAYKIIKIDAKTIQKFNKLDLSVIKLDKDGTGFRVASGKHYDYVFANYLVEVSETPL